MHMRNLIFISFITMLTLNAMAQIPQQKREQLESMRIGFITRHLSLTSAEAQQFWPVYNEYQADLQQLKKTRRNNNIAARSNLNTMSDSEIEKLVDDQIIHQQRELDIKKKYHARFKEVLPIKKVAKLYHAEEQFKRELLKRLQERRR